jgi:hypothetical protein
VSPCFVVSLSVSLPVSLPVSLSLLIPCRDILWFNIKDLRSLAPLGELLKLHNVTLAQFYDLRFCLLSSLCSPSALTLPAEVTHLSMLWRMESLCVLLSIVR